MDQFVSLIGALVVMWLVVVGITVMVRGPQAGVTVFTWPIRATFRVLRRMIGGMLVALGEFIRR